MSLDGFRERRPERDGAVQLGNLNRTERRCMKAPDDSHPWARHAASQSGRYGLAVYSFGGLTAPRVPRATMRQMMIVTPG